MTDITSIPLNKLAAWSGNVRKTAGADTALAELAASIAAHGLLQSLVVRKGKKGSYAVVAGGRRRRRSDPADPWPVPQGGPSILEAAQQPIEHDPGPGVIGIDR